MANPVLTPQRIGEAAEEFEPGWALAPQAGAGAQTDASGAIHAPGPAVRTMTAGGTFAMR